MERRRAIQAMVGTAVGVVTAAVGTTRTFAAPPPERVLQGVPSYHQQWSLSCEYAAVSAATGLWGERLSESQMHREIGNHLNPHKGFRGDIAGGPWGSLRDYGVYPEPIVPVLKRHGFLASRAFRAGTDTIRREIAAGHPVVIWLVGNYIPQRRTYLSDGRDSYFVIPYEHAVTLYGYDPRGVHVMDPGSGGKYHQGWDGLEFAWAQLDHMGLVVAK